MKAMRSIPPPKKLSDPFVIWIHLDSVCTGPDSNNVFAAFGLNRLREFESVLRRFWDADAPPPEGFYYDFRSSRVELTFRTESEMREFENLLKLHFKGGDLPYYAKGDTSNRRRSQWFRDRGN